MNTPYSKQCNHFRINTLNLSSKLLKTNLHSRIH